MAIPSYYKSPNGDFTLIQGDCVETLSKFRFGFDMVFADPPYFLSGGGISCRSGRVVCVDKGEWDKPTTLEKMDEFNLKWITACREHMKDNATIWISGTHHNIFSVQQQLLKSGFKILNVITWVKTNPPAQHFMPLLYILDRVHNLGKKVAQGCPLLQLRPDEAA